jgi:hypothetical protein
MLSGLRRSGVRFLVAHHDSPWANLPLLRDAIPHIRILARKVFSGGRIGRVKDKERARG